MATNKHKGTCYIDIGGKKRGLVFNLNAIDIMCQGLNIEFEHLEQAFVKRKLISLCWLIYGACIAYDEKHSKDIDYNIHDFFDWCLNISKEDTEMVMQTFIASQTLENDSNNGLSRKVVKSTKDDVKKN